ncbi:MAG: hypothetical protein WCV41_03030 [Patescibacteria group bacterium]
MEKDMLGTVVKKIVNLPAAKLGVIYDLIEKLLSDAGQEWLVELKKFLRKEICWAVKEVYAKIISEPLVIDAVDGSEILVNATDLFAYIDHDFKNWGADEPGQLTAETSVVAREMCNDATFVQIFGRLNPDVSKLCFTQHQIRKFVTKYRDRLRSDSYATFFLFKSNNHIFVAIVRVNSSGRLSVNVRRFEDSEVWDAKNRCCLVVPQLT